MLADPMPSLHECLPDARAPVGLAALLIDHPDVRHQRAVSSTTLTLGPHAPSVVPRGRHGEGPTHQPDGIAAAALLDRAGAPRDSPARKAATRRTKNTPY